MAVPAKSGPVKRRWFAVLGSFVLLGWSALALAFGLPDEGEAAFLLNDVPLLLGGAALVAGGATDGDGGVAWYRLVGAGFVLLGLSMAGQFLATLAAQRTLDGLLAADAVTLVPAVAVALVGLDWIRGGKHFDLSVFEAGPLLG